MGKTLRPIGDQVLVELVEEDSKTPGGIILPDNAKERPTRGLVKAVGPGRRLDGGGFAEPCVCTGEQVLFRKYAEQEFVVDGKKMHLVREHDILAIIEE